MCRGMRLHITPSLRARREPYAERECTMAGSVYHALQWRFAVNGNVLLVRWKVGIRWNVLQDAVRVSGNEG